MKTNFHPHETVLETYDVTGITAELVQWDAAIWCGCLEYAANNTDEPDVDAALNRFMALPFDAVRKAEEDWDICVSLNYLSADRPNGVMFGFLAESDEQPEECNILRTPAALYIRIALTDETAHALGHDPWPGGIPPHEWIGKQIAPTFGYSYGSDTLPIVEYYGFYDPAGNAHTYRYLYVPVEKVEE